jgi:hypothetical protein
MRFGIPGHADMTTVSVQDLDEFDAVARPIRKLAREQEMSIQVDLQASSPGEDDPVLVQFLVGDDERSSLLWHMDGVGFVAVDPHIQRLDHAVQFTHFHDVEFASPDETRVAQATVREAIAVYLLTGQRTEGLGWREIPAG